MTGTVIHHFYSMCCRMLDSRACSMAGAFGCLAARLRMIS